jgi:hypothetical protein
MTKHIVFALALLVGASGALATVAPRPPARHTGFDCVIPYGDRWIPCSTFKHLEAKA